MENQPVVSISRVRRNCQVKCYFSLKDCSVLLPSAARVCGQRFCGRLVILSSHAARYVFASRYGAHACFSASHRAVPLDQQLGDRAGFSTSPYIIQHWHNVHRRATLMKRDRAWSRTLAQVTMFSALRDLGAVGTRANKFISFTMTLPADQVLNVSQHSTRSKFTSLFLQYLCIFNSINYLMLYSNFILFQFLCGIHC